ncbi:anti-sigma factor [Rhizosaccharibacter radicis]|uniref:Anti-sigma factor n=1 Tax=Rhizosaccharibacter radicis TaxID=2782605 RepID=A0ABT1W1R4_9PROT|nr:anti-sigma factor [Acetobacteraceae bacterium KSS12]
MSDDPDFPHDRGLRADEYVLGLGDATERLALEREMGSDVTLARVVAGWEQRLGPLLAGFRPVSPPQELWTRLSRSAFGKENVTTSPARSIARGRLAAGALGFALAAGIAFAVVVGRSLLLPPAPPVPLAALVPRTAGAPVLLVWRDGDGGLLVRSIGAMEAPIGKGYELWSLRSESKIPVALGMLRNGKAMVAGSHVPAGPGLILVSLEAPDGSKTGLPQGPVLWSGAFPGS